MAAAMEAGSAISNRNRAIVSALCKRLFIDPSISTDSIGGYDLMSLYSNILKLSASRVHLDNQTEIMKWVKFASDFPCEANACRATLKQLNEDLNQRAVLLGDGLKPSEADIIIFSAVHSILIHLTNAEVQEFPNLMRWMDYIQNKVDFGGAFETVVVNKPAFELFFSKKLKADGELSSNKASRDLKNADKPEQNMNANKGSAEKNVATNEKATETQKSNKSTEEKKKSSEKDSAEKDTEASISILNIQVGIIRKAWKHPSADSLLVEEIDLGEGNLRQVVSGLAKYCSPEELTNRHVVLISNVKPGKLRDVMSAGLVLCASNQDHTVVEPIVPPEGVAIGERVFVAGHDGKPEDVLNPKKKQLEKITPFMYTDDKGVATYKGIPFMTSAGPCSSSIPNASIK
ncbi:putative methionine--tRNA ligase [Dioscorea sansibarensis]